jgi:hypothetical protein
MKRALWAGLSPRTADEHDGPPITIIRAAQSCIGVSILPRSSLLPGMQVLPKGRDFPDPGQLNVGVLRGAGVPGDIMAALERVIGQILDVLALTRPAAR